MTKDVWKYATTMLGAPSAMTDGIPWMLMLFVVSLDSQIKVKKLIITQLIGSIAISCMIMKFTGAVPRLSAYFGPGTGSIVRQYVRCTGSENRLIDCPTSSSSCTHSEDAGVTCLPTGE